jgi:hypothetical protein
MTRPDDAPPEAREPHPSSEPLEPADAGDYPKPPRKVIGDAEAAP